MNCAKFRFYAQLNYFLPPRIRQVSFDYRFEQGQSAKHLVEAIGVPHPEIDLILANGEPVDFDYLVNDRDRVSVYPVFESIDVDSLTQVRPQPLQEPRFVLDAHLGRLAAYLRMVGFDTRYRNDYSDVKLAEISSSEGRILLTRDRGLLKRNLVTHGYCMRETDPEAQLAEVMRRFDLIDHIDPFRRCISCNGILEPVDKELILDCLPPRTREYYREFQICQSCKKIFWKGSHVKRMEQLIARVVGNLKPLNVK